MDKFQQVLDKLRSRYGEDKVLVRESSSGDGYHIRVLVDMDPAEELELREELGDCAGRCIADKTRLKAGMRTSRLFKYRSTCEVDQKTGEIKSTKSRKAKEWSTSHNQ